MPEPIIVAHIPTVVTVVLAMLCIGITLLGSLCAYILTRYFQLNAYVVRQALVLTIYQQLGVLTQDYLDNREYVKKTNMAGQSLTAETYQDVLRNQMRDTLNTLKEIK